MECTLFELRTSRSIYSSPGTRYVRLPNPNPYHIRVPTHVLSQPDYGDQDFPDHLAFHSARPALITPQGQNRACMAIIALGPGLKLPLDRAGEFGSSKLFDDDGGKDLPITLQYD